MIVEFCTFGRDVSLHPPLLLPPSPKAKTSVDTSVRITRSNNGSIPSLQGLNHTDIAAKSYLDDVTTIATMVWGRLESVKE
jgi:hypothetical protein